MSMLGCISPGATAGSRHCSAIGLLGTVGELMNFEALSELWKNAHKPSSTGRSRSRRCN